MIKFEIIEKHNAIANFEQLKWESSHEMKWKLDLNIFHNFAHITLKVLIFVWSFSAQKVRLHLKMLATSKINGEVMTKLFHQHTPPQTN